MKKLLKYLSRYLCRKGSSQQAWVAQTLHIPKKGSSFNDICLIRSFMLTMCFMVNTCFCSEGLASVPEVHRAVITCLTWLTPNKKPDSKAQVSFPADNTLHLWSLYTVAGKIPHAHMLLLGEDTWKFMLGFSWILPPWTFSLC